jgi:hypothetical protein
VADLTDFVWSVIILIVIVCYFEMENDMSNPGLTEDEINQLAKELAEITLTEDIEAEFEAYMDAAWAEHEMQMYAANSYDNDAIAYGEF